MIRKHYKKLIALFLFVAFVVSLMILLHFFSPAEIVDRVGIQNSYIIAFVVSFFGGFSTWSSFSFISTLVTLVAGGLNPIYLGIIAGISLAAGDLIMFYLGSKGRELVVGKWERRLKKIAKYIKDKKIEKFIPFIAYLFIGFAPIPNDFIILFLAFIEFPRRKIYLPIILGGLTFALLICILASKGILLFS